MFAVEEVEKLKEHPYRNFVSDSEDYDSFVKRVKKAFENVVKEDYQTIAIITHGGPIKALFREVFNFGEFKELGFTPTDVRDLEGANLRGEATMRMFRAQPAGFKNWLISQTQAGNVGVIHSTDSLQEKINEWKETTQTKKKDEGEAPLTAAQIRNFEAMVQDSSREDIERYIRDGLQRDPNESVFAPYLR